MPRRSLLLIGILSLPAACLIASLCASPVARAGWNLDEIQKKVGAATQAAGVGTGTLSNDEVIRGLKEALSIGTNKAAGLASAMDGFYRNSRIRIPCPPEARKVMAAAEAIGMQRQAEDFVRTLNRAAEEAAKRAAPIFLDAIRQLTIEDGITILKGPDNAATSYLQRKTTVPLTRAFRPVVDAAIAKVDVTRYWTPLANAYNRVPLVQKVNPDLGAYVTERGLAGLFWLIADQEKKIRKDPAARTTELLRRVFGSAGR